MLRNAMVYRAGTIVPAVPRNQAREWIRIGIAKELPETPEIESAALESRDAIESADARPARRKRR